jgi:hypothetical protein
MKNKFSILLMAAVLLTASFGCKKKEEEASTSPSVDSNTGLKKDGSFIKGTVVTSDENDKPMEFSFDYVYKDSDFYFTGGTGSDYIGNEGTFYKAFTDYYDNDYESSAELYFRLDSLGDRVPEDAYLDLNALADLPAGRAFYFDVNDEVALSNFKFDTLAGVASADFVMNSDNTDNGNDAVIRGSFQYNNVKRLVFRKGK